MSIADQTTAPENGTRRGSLQQHSFGAVPRWARRRIQSALMDAGCDVDSRDVAALARRTGLTKGLARACLALDALDARSGLCSSQGLVPSRARLGPRPYRDDPTRAFT